jgi:hypothetical protein
VFGSGASQVSVRKVAGQFASNKQMSGQKSLKVDGHEPIHKMNGEWLGARYQDLLQDLESFTELHHR